VPFAQANARQTRSPHPLKHGRFETPVVDEVADLGRGQASAVTESSNSRHAPASRSGRRFVPVTGGSCADPSNPENIFPPVAATQKVTDGSFILDPELAWHAVLIETRSFRQSRNLQNVGPTPIAPLVFCLGYVRC
jgi:hypothetical protein